MANMLSELRKYLVGFTVASAATAAAPTIVVFVACQFVARCFIATQVAIAWTMAAEDLPADRRGFGFGGRLRASSRGSRQRSRVTL